MLPFCDWFLSLISLSLENTLRVIFIVLNFLRFVFWPRIWLSCYILSGCLKGLCILLLSCAMFYKFDWIPLVDGFVEFYILANFSVQSSCQ